MTKHRKAPNPLVWVLTGLVRGYQLIVSPWFTPRCRYYPSCSAYALDALHTHGPFTSAVLAIWRVLRCNPWSSGGVDKVPSRENLPWRRRRTSSTDCLYTPTDPDGPPSDPHRIAWGTDLRLDHRLSHQSPQQRI